ncbi:VOC family protein [Pseudomonas aeruginosa]|nr:VOC family protein [Pseudomonas aeruginosa]QNE60060.1 VOC family protein [Pseudomonas aeruginosa]HBP6330535.1 VOC family protein [Pseudomonas aeruginosa]HEJ3633909.1 VOC family protein [Pseudomonas aeruginosa]
MIAYTMVGTTDLNRSARFYEPIFSAMGLEISWRDERSVAWGVPGNRPPTFHACLPYNQEEARPGNGTMTALLTESPALIGRLFELALENGGTDEGSPGPRPEYGTGFYAAYVRDPDGNKLAFVYFDDNQCGG